MRTNVVFTILGDDKAGLVESISRIVTENRGNWLSSRLSQLAGKFAGIIQVEADDEDVGNLINSLMALQTMGLTVAIEKDIDRARIDSDQTSPAGDIQIHQLTMLGLDRPGIVRDVSHALASQGINVLELETNIVKAAMTGEPMFDASALIEYSSHTDPDSLVEDLDRISRDLGVDIELASRDQPK